MTCISITTPLESGFFFHIYNRGINGEKIFYTPDHFYQFLFRYRTLLSNYVETYSYCLIPNHFHFLIRIKDSNTPGYETLVSNQLNILFSQHALMINRQTGRYGSLFCKSFRRLKISSGFYLQNLVVYIHKNPKKHGIIKDYKAYPYSSFQGIILKQNKIVRYNNTLSLFSGMEEFYEHHNDEDPLSQFLGKLIIEKQHITEL